MLSLVPTPIGHLKDFTIRAEEILRSCDLILCEDCRHTGKLLHHYKIPTPCRSYHRFRASSQHAYILSLLKEGKHLALVSDAGSPSLSDPGQELVVLCRTEGISVQSLPGPSAFLTALTSSGFPSESFQFLSFLPKKEAALRLCFFHILRYRGTSIVYESPHRLHKSLALLDTIAPDVELCLARELTKRFESMYFGHPQDIIKQSPLKGEMVLLFKEYPFPQEEFSALSAADELHRLCEDFGLSRKEAIAFLVKEKGIKREWLYHKH